MTVVLRRPEELGRLDLGHSAVIEASAGTGKTYLLEHLALELIISGRARLDEILIVTFTERATAELVVRIRHKLEQALAVRGPAQVVGWTIDAPARARLREARQSFDQATIATIHAFCQRILTDEPLITSRLLAQTRVDGAELFGEVFRDVLRRTLATPGAHAAYLSAYLANRGGIDDLEDLLYRSASARGEWGNPFDEAELRRLTEQLARLDLDAAKLPESLCKRGMHKQSVNALIKRLRRLIPEAQAALASAGWSRMLACFDAEMEMFKWLETVAGWDEPLEPVLSPLREIAVLALRAAPPLDHAIAQRFLPLIEDRLQQRKLAEGVYDYDDMIRGVDAAIAGTRGAALIESLRRRYKIALVDEAQDTEPAQWRIFSRVFLDSAGPHPVVLIGDPKQAIYGFRGADVHTYVQAREEIRARGGTVLPLARNFRSHPEVVAAYNAILDQASNPPYFSGTHIGYDHPVTAAKPPLGTGPGVTLFQAEVRAEAGRAATTVRIGPIRQALRDVIAVEIQRLRATPERPRLSEMFVLTRSNGEAREMAARLHGAGIPNVLFKQDDLFGSAEAAHVRALLLAIADPADRAARLGAWLTPFFEVSLQQLANCADLPPEHPLMARLLVWKGLADAHGYDQLWSRILDDSGVIRRLRFAPSGARRLTNYRHLFDVLQATAAARPLTIADLAALLGAFAAGRRRRGSADDATQRLETDQDAVRVMTIHAAKGLEADYVFVYGGLTGVRFWRGVHALQQQAVRLRCAGKPRRQSDIALIDAAREEEAQRLLYVAMTRARKHLYLPFFPATEAGDPEGERASGDFDPFKKISGEYRHVNQRLRALTAPPLFAGAAGETAPGIAPFGSGSGSGSTLFGRHPIVLEADPPQPTADIERALDEWRPPAAAPVDAADSDTDNEHDPGDNRGGDQQENYDPMARLRTRRRGFALTSYSRLSEAEGGAGHRPPRPKAANAEDGSAASSIPLGHDEPGSGAALDPLERLDIDPSSGRGPGGPANPPSAETLPGGLASGLFLHAVLEKAALGEIHPLVTWRSQPEVRHLLESEARRWERDPRHLDQAARLVHAALTVPIDMPDGSRLSGMARASRMRREIDFLFPLPHPPAEGALSPGGEAGSEDRLVHERGFVRGALDVLFEHGGRVCFADWKSNVLTDFSAASVQEHVARNYDLQVQIYTLAVIRMLGVSDRTAYERKFGGVVYLFLRGLTAPDRAPGDGLYVHRPDYAAVEKWREDLARRRVAGAGDDW